MTDSISRQGAIAKVKELFEMGECYCDKHSIVGALNELPSAETQWIPIEWIRAFGESPITEESADMLSDVGGNYSEWMIATWRKENESRKYTSREMPDM